MFFCVLCVLGVLLVASEEMGTKEKDKTGLDMASGGVPEVEEFEEEWQALETRLKNVSVGKRRRTMDRMSRLLEASEDLEDPGERQGTPPVPQMIPQVIDQRTLTVEPSTRKLRNFSGSDKPSNGEVDFKHWKRAALRIVEDTEISSAHKKRIVLQSLQIQ